MCKVEDICKHMQDREANTFYSLLSIFKESSFKNKFQLHTFDKSVEIIYNVDGQVFFCLFVLGIFCFCFALAVINNYLMSFILKI